MTRLALVGCGARGRSHLAAAYTIDEQEYLLCGNDPGYPHWTYHEYTPESEIPDWAEDISDLSAEVTAVCDPDPASREKALALCAEHGDDPTAYDSFEELLEDGSYDAVVVASPNDFHVQQSVRLLESDHNVLSEKPIATALSDHDRLADAAGAASSVYFVGFNLRSSPFYTRLKSLLEEGRIGELGMIGCRECRGHFTARYSFSQDRSGGALLDKNCHDFDLYNWYTGADPVAVTAYGGQHVHTENTDINDHSTVIVRYDDGSVGNLELCMYTPFGQRTRMYELRGSDGILRAPNESGAVDLYTRESQDRLTVSQRGGGHGGADTRQMKRFLRCLAGDADPPATIEDAKKADAIALAGERSIIEGGEVGIDGSYDLV